MSPRVDLSGVDGLLAPTPLLAIYPASAMPPQTSSKRTSGGACQGSHSYVYVLHVKVPGVAEGIQRTIVLICWEVSGARFNRERLGCRTDAYLLDFTIRTLFLDHGIFRVCPQAQVLQPPLLEQH